MCIQKIISTHITVVVTTEATHVKSGVKQTRQLTPRGNEQHTCWRQSTLQRDSPSDINGWRSSAE